MKTFYAKIIIFFGLLALSTPALAQDEPAAPDLVKIVNEYFEAYAAINQFEISAEAGPHFDSFFTSDMSYEIPKMELVFAAEDFLGSEPMGGRKRNAVMTIEELIIGPGVVFVKYRSDIEIKRDEEWKQVSGVEYLVFEFEDDKIKRVINY